MIVRHSSAVVYNIVILCKVHVVILLIGVHKLSVIGPHSKLLQISTGAF